MSEKFNRSYFRRLQFVLTLLFVYIVLFEFILPVNKVLPRPSLLWESLLAVWPVYNLLFEISISTFIIYGAIISGYLLLYILRIPILKLLSIFSGGLELLKVFKFFPAFFYAIIFAYWFPESIIAEFIFILIAVLFYLFAAVKEYLPNLKENYILVAKNLETEDNKLYSEILWKQLQPEIFSSLRKMHYFAWILVLIFEYISNYAGIGHIYNVALSYNDFAGLFSIAIYAAILILIGDSLIKFSKIRFIYWDK